MIWLLNYHLFGPFGGALRGRHFASEEEVNEAVDAWLVTHPKTFVSEDIQKFVDGWTSCVEKERDYI
jgi:hypothetical protein